MQDGRYRAVPSDLPFGLQRTLLSFLSVSVRFHNHPSVPPVPSPWSCDETCPYGVTQIVCLGMMSDGCIAFLAQCSVKPDQLEKSLEFLISPQGEIVWHSGDESMIKQVFGGVYCHCCSDEISCQQKKIDFPKLDIGFVQLPCCEHFVHKKCFSMTQEAVGEICPCCGKNIDWNAFDLMNHHKRSLFYFDQKKSAAGKDQGPVMRLLNHSTSLTLRLWCDQVQGWSSRALSELSLPTLWLLIFRINKLSTLKTILGRNEWFLALRCMGSPRHLVSDVLREMCLLTPAQLASCLTGNLCYLVQQPEAGVNPRDKVRFLINFLRQCPNLFALLSCQQGSRSIIGALKAGKLDILKKLPSSDLAYLKGGFGLRVWRELMRQADALGVGVLGLSARFSVIHRCFCRGYNPFEGSAGQALSAQCAPGYPEVTENEPKPWQVLQMHKGEEGTGKKRGKTLSVKRVRSKSNNDVVATATATDKKTGRKRRNTVAGDGGALKYHHGPVRLENTKLEKSGLGSMVTPKMAGSEPVLDTDSVSQGGSNTSLNNPPDPGQGGGQISMISFV